MLLETLNILENFDLRSMGHNSADYLHTLIEAMKLAYADRDTLLRRSGLRRCARDEGLLSKEYARERAALIDMTTRLERFSSPATRCRTIPTSTTWPYWIAGARPTG